ncbi:MAG: Mov34/MPN/PAD-1 family protein [Thermoanaerobaculia bacterium]
MAKNRNGGGSASPGDARVSGPSDTVRVTRRSFPGPAGTTVPLRVNFARRAYAELTAHAKESVDAEVGGVLIGEVCEDNEGLFLDVRAVIRAMAAREARAHITFTHETWTQIHATLDKSYPDFQIIGWYHTHPGFGVEFSTMDRFIQQNFFSGRTQIGYLTDPLGGDTAICFNAPTGIEPLSKFWVDGREHSTRTPPGHDASPEATSGAGSPDVRRDIERLESRINHLIQAVDEQRTNFNRVLFVAVIVICGGFIAWVGYSILSDRMDRLQPPKIQSYVPVPVKIGDETVMIGVGIVNWRIPPRLDAYLEKLAKIELEGRRQTEQQLREIEKKHQQAPKKPPQ